MRIVKTLVLGLFFGPLISATMAYAGARETITSSCKTQLGMTPSQCSCVADAAEKTFSPKQMEFFLAVVTDDDKRRIAAQVELTMEEMFQISQSMEKIPAKCSGN